MPGDAQFQLATAVRRWLLAAGYDSEVLAAHVEAAARGQAIPYSDWGALKPEDVLVYHFGLSGEATKISLAHARRGGPLVLYFHSFTPPEYFRYENPIVYAALLAAGEAVRGLKDATLLAIADSGFGAQQLRAVGYPKVEVVSPVVLDQQWDAAPDPHVLQRFADGSVNILYVGRIAPNKRQEDLIKTFYYYRRINPGSRLLLVGDPGTTMTYQRWLEDLACLLGLKEMHFCGHVSQAALKAYYQVADVFVSMSEHEGFGVPLVESMHMDVPVVAYASSAVPETLGGAGVLVTERDLPAVAELVALIVEDAELRESILEGQRRRVRAFEEEAIRRRFWLAISCVLDRQPV